MFLELFDAGSECNNDLQAVNSNMDESSTTYRAVLKLNAPAMDLHTFLYIRPSYRNNSDSCMFLLKFRSSFAL